MERSLEGKIRTFITPSRRKRSIINYLVCCIVCVEMGKFPLYNATQVIEFFWIHLWIWYCYQTLPNFSQTNGSRLHPIPLVSIFACNSKLQSRSFYKYDAFPTIPDWQNRPDQWFNMDGNGLKLKWYNIIFKKLYDQNIVYERHKYILRTILKV